MRKTRWAMPVVCAGFLIMAVAGWAKANLRQAAAQANQNSSEKTIFNRRPFSADMVITPGKNSGQQIHGKIFAGNHAMRMEMEVRPGMESVSIVRYDKKVVWILIPGQQRYMEMPLTGRAGVIAELRDPSIQYEVQNLGADKVGEYACEKYQVRWKNKGEEYNSLVWIDASGAAKGFVVRTEDEKTGAISQFENIRPGEPDGSVFEVPAGYQKMEMPGMPHD